MLTQNFSAAITSKSGTSPVQAKLQLVTNDSASAAVAALAGGDVVGPVLILVGWTLATLFVSVLATSRQRPELALAARPAGSPPALLGESA